VEPLAGYLSLHQNADGLAMKWTPNQLMKGGGSEDEENNTTVDRRYSCSTVIFRVF
jgi:small G protein signaling modulator 1